MVEIEYNNIKISVPENWDDITLGTYEKIYGKTPETMRERVAVIADICNADLEHLLSWPAEVFNFIVDRLHFLYQEQQIEPSPCITIGEVNYIVPIEEKLTLGAWIDAEEVQKKQEKVLSNMLAIVCRPAGEAYNCENNEQRAAMFAALPVSKVLPLTAFFLNCKSVLEQRTVAYSNTEEAVFLLVESIKNLRLRGVGIRLSTIWPMVKFWSMIVLLRYRWAKFLRKYNTTATSNMQRMRNMNLIKS